MKAKKVSGWKTKMELKHSLIMMKRLWVLGEMEGASQEEKRKGKSGSKTGIMNEVGLCF